MTRMVSSYASRCLDARYVIRWKRIWLDSKGGRKLWRLGGIGLLVSQLKDVGNPFVGGRGPPWTPPPLQVPPTRHGKFRKLRDYHSLNGGHRRSLAQSTLNEWPLAGEQAKSLAATEALRRNTRPNLRPGDGLLRKRLHDSLKWLCVNVGGFDDSGRF